MIVYRESKGINWLAWDKLCALKEDGGMGFQNGGNATIPNALSSRILKAKYFNGGDFMHQHTCDLQQHAFALTLSKKFAKFF